MASISIPNIPIALPFLSKSKSHFSQNPSLLFTPLSLSPKPIPFHNPNNRKNKGSKFWITLATPEEVLPSDSRQIVSTTGDEGVATVIQALLFVAFVALTILTIGVIYIAVQDFLEKREIDKYEKEEAAKNKNVKKKKVRARAGPRGFGQKVDEDDEDF
ncbi:pumilio-like protein 1-like [Hibiscus syriacus]|uniref:Pumilio-like protein 1-like n=1 Tax=Hibiscus syriacus TaxID=106335 RepID=A0A6A2ZIA2_HIBSY|nr:uncharacterized protein LOC120145130 [Hibiscus syriacus]KAE8691079.1 pumilio-like protein 1-like [Hibiscus syriacus]